MAILVLARSAASLTAARAAGARSAPGTRREQAAARGGARDRRLGAAVGRAAAGGPARPYAAAAALRGRRASVRRRGAGRRTRCGAGGAEWGGKTGPLGRGESVAPGRGCGPPGPRAAGGDRSRLGPRLALLLLSEGAAEKRAVPWEPLAWDESRAAGRNGRCGPCLCAPWKRGSWPTMAVDRALRSARLSQQVGLPSSALPPRIPPAARRRDAARVGPLGWFFGSLCKTVGFWAGRRYVRRTRRGGSHGPAARLAAVATACPTAAGRRAPSAPSLASLGRAARAAPGGLCRALKCVLESRVIAVLHLHFMPCGREREE